MPEDSPPTPDRPGATPAPPPAVDREQEAANRSLANALRWSLRLLTAIMIVVGVMFLLSGLRTIEPQQVGVIQVFGRLVGVARQGLTFTWPYPVGEVRVVDINEKSVRIEDFWMHETAKDKATPLSERTAMSEGLRPGWDGALFTGDRNLLHVRLKCRYRVQDAARYLRQVQETDVREQTVLRELVRSLADRAAIHAAATRTADVIYTAGREAFGNEVAERTQRQINLVTADRRRLEGLLSALRGLGEQRTRTVRRAVREGRFTAALTRLEDVLAAVDDPAAAERLRRRAADVLAEAVRIVKVEVNQASWPLQARGAYEEAQRASSENRTRISQADASARETLRSAAGDNYATLVGQSSELRRPGAADAPAGGDPNADLIDQYDLARRRGDLERARRLLARIYDVLLDEKTTGEAYQIIRAAEAERVASNEPLKAWHRRFRLLLPKYRQAPATFVALYWLQAAGDVLNADTNEAYMGNPRGKRYLVQIRRPPQIVERIRRATLKARQEQDEAQQREQSPPPPGGPPEPAP
jgi:regulator of protease activity HflC (stomatin/prohibitin superfamily)